VGAGLVLPFANADMMNLHLAEISAHVLPGAHAVLTIDGAGWHQTGDKLRVPDNITLLTLLPYSPELNPVENVWASLRGNKLSNRVFANYDAIVDACCDAWNWLTAQPRRITAIASRAWARVNARRRTYKTPCRRFPRIWVLRGLIPAPLTYETCVRVG
jgi:transposase